ncbi:MAG: hypothetical protein ASARMPRED_003541 [Alectoria sarmentosa]|nr:MAG: hypothetical protein ASARMPRED_003541 [Alectoria sarmentosa]
MAPPASRLRSAMNVKQTSRTRSTRNHVSYREQTSDSGSEESNDTAGEDDLEVTPLRPQRHRAPPSAPAVAPQQLDGSRKRKAIGPGHRRQHAVTKRVRLSGHDTDSKNNGDTAIQFTGKTMPWPTLPYHILLAIFDYASRPLVSDTFQPMPSINWLYSIALCCKAFAEPSLSCLYKSPPLHPPSRAHRLLAHLANYKDTSAFNYGAKIKYLEVEALSTILRKFVGWDPLDLGALVSLTPQLRGIALHLYSDNLTWRKSGRSRTVAGSRAVYQHSMIAALREQKIMLQDWTWNHSLAKQSQSAFPLAQMKEVHMMPPFQTLRSLTLVNYPAGPIEKERPCEDMLAEAINLLPKLKDLHFHLSSVNERLLSRIPHDLQTLEIVECPVLKSSSLAGFLAAKGGNLRQLILDHNQSLNLSFLTRLAQFCPKLELFKADLRYFGTLNVTRDTDPKYDALLLEYERPTWPMGLQNLELFHLRRWNLQTAELFFSSLTDSAELLPNLRQLKIKASLDESGWRERIAFRDSWTEKLRRVFLRRSPPPNPYLKSISAFKAFKSLQKKGKMAAVRKDQPRSFTRATASVLNNERTFQASRVEVAPQTMVKNASESDSDAPLVKVRRSTRAKTQREDIYTLSESPPIRSKAPRRRRRRKGSDDSSSEDSAIDDDGIMEPDTQGTSVDGEPDLYVQGLCDVVDVLIDNLRPTEEQLNEDDFLDDEVSGDEDWNGDDDMPGDGGYAW